jgi:hypothetical protein
MVRRALNKICDSIQSVLIYAMIRIESSRFFSKIPARRSQSRFTKQTFDEQIHSFTNITDTRLYFPLPPLDPNKPYQTTFLHFVYFKPIPNWNIPFQTIEVTANMKSTTSKSDVFFGSDGMFLYFHSKLMSTRSGKDPNLEGHIFLKYKNLWTSLPVKQNCSTVTFRFY